MFSINKALRIWVVSTWIREHCSFVINVASTDYLPVAVQTRYARTLNKAHHDTCADFIWSGGCKNFFENVDNL
uniref:Putative secreted protein n=1 Tax=Rhipicephalus microplus TaxID=6941 RepID=A0A6G5A4F7_RHIMP